MTEYDSAVELANRVLDKPGADPDGDLCVLARQFLRAVERSGEWAAKFGAKCSESERYKSALYDIIT